MSEEIQHEARVAESKQYHETQKKRRGRPKAKKEDLAVKDPAAEYARLDNKVIKIQRTDMGTYSTYIGKYKDYKHLLG